jgi:hypothetical protein
MVSLGRLLAQAFGDVGHELLQHRVQLSNLGQVFFLEEGLTKFPILLLVQQPLQLHCSPRVVDHHSFGGLFRPPLLEPLLLAHAQVNGKAQRPLLKLELAAVPASLERLADLGLLRIFDALGKEFTLVDVYAVRVG